MKKLALLVLAFFGAHFALAEDLYVATYNIRYDNPGDRSSHNGWPQRCPFVSSLIRFHDFDFVGSQEVVENQLKDMLGLMPEYDFIGGGRNDGKSDGEYVAVFYKKDKFTLLDKGIFWLSETPDAVGSKGWDARHARVCTWGKFQTKAAGAKQTVYVFNTHMDHVGVKARVESAKLILKKMQEIAGDAPALLMGDFNVTQKSAPYATFAQSGFLADCFDAAPIKYYSNGTFNGFDVARKTDDRIDHIFITKKLAAERYAILGDCYWVPIPKEMQEAEAAEKAKGGGAKPKANAKKGLPRMPSDHFPVAVKLRLAD